VQPVLPLQAIKRGQRHAKAAVQVAQGLKQLGFQLWVRCSRSFYLLVGVARVFRVLARGLRQRIGAYRFSLN
jgi:hypothetical protein